MKIKSLLIIALTTSVVLGTIADPAEARRRSRYSSRGQDQDTVGATFNLFDQTEDEQPIIDKTIVNGVDTDFKLGFFEGAVENYKVLTKIDKQTNPIDDILLPVGTLIDKADFEAELVSAFSIKYRIKKNGTLIEDFILDFKNTDSDGDVSFIDNKQDTILEVKNFDINKAINDISYIADKNLLIATTPSFNSAFNDLLPDTVLEGTDEVNSTKVPESSTINTLLILGILGTGLLLKRKIKNNRIYSAKL